MSVRNNESKRKRVLLICALFCVLALAVNAAYAVVYVTKKDFVKKNIPEKSTLTKVSVPLSAENKKLLAGKWKLDMLPVDTVFILGRNEAGKVSGAVYFTTVYATEHKCVHHMAIALNPDGSVKEVAVQEVFCELAMPVAQQSFLGQFKNKAAKLLSLNKDVSAVTRATESSKAVLGAVNTAIALYTEFIIKK